MSTVVIPNLCLVDVNTRGSATYYASIGSRVYRYTYASFTACLQDPYPKCSTLSSGVSNLYCTGIRDVTPAAACSSDNTDGNYKFYYTPASSSSNNSLSAGAIAGIVIGVVVFALLVCVCVFFAVKLLKGRGGSSSSGNHPHLILLN